jgi:hypothetical protein
MSKMALLLLMVLSASGGVSGEPNSAYEAAFRASFRSQAVAKCEAKILSDDARDTNAHEFCECSIDKILASLTLDQLRKYPSPSQLKVFSGECFKTHPPPELTPTIFRSARLLMSVSQVKALFPLALAPDHPNQLNGLQEGLVLKDQLEGKPAEVGFYFSGDALAMVTIGSKGPQVDRAYVERVVAGLTATYGAPSDATDEKTPPAGPGWTESSRKWFSGSTQITLLATPSIRPINAGREQSEHAVIVFYYPSSSVRN